MRGTGVSAHQQARESRAGEPSDFEAFFEAEQDRLFRALLLVTGSRHEAEDLLQEAFVRVWERWSTVSEMVNPVGYLHRTAINAFRSRRRHALGVAKRRLLLDRDQGDPLVGIETREAAVRALMGLTRRQRAAVVLTRVLRLLRTGDGGGSLDPARHRACVALTGPGQSQGERRR